jgi:hypothetical protein
MALETPAWLAQRNGALKPASDGPAWHLLLNQQPQYGLTPVPVQGEYGCVIKQTNNGRRIESTGVYPSAEEALRGGLEDLRRALGW